MSQQSQTSPQLLYRFSVLGFLAFLLLSLALAFYHRSEFQIETDLRSITPHFIANKDLETVINRLSANLEQQFYVVLKSQQEEDLETASDLIEEWLEQEQPAGFELVSAAQNFSTITDLLLQYRYQLLTDQQMEQLQNSSDQQLQQQAEQRLFSLSGARLFGISEDPMGFLSDYALATAEQLGNSSSGEIIAIEKGAQAFYYLPFQFRVSANAGSFDQQQNILYQLEVLQRYLDDRIIGLEYLHSGVVFFAAEASTAAKADIALISAGSTLGILLLIIIVFRSVGPLVLPLLSIAVGVGAAFLYCQIVFGSIHIFTIVFGASLIGVVIDYSLHYCYHFGKNSNHALNKLYKALLLSLVTSVIGYSALAFSGLDVLKQVAAFSAIGLVVAWVTVLLLGRFLLAQQKNVHDAWLRRCITIILHRLGKINRTHWVSALVVIMATSVVLIFTLLTSEDSPRFFVNPNPVLLQQQEELQDLLSQYEPATFLVMRRQSLQELFDMTAELRARLSSAGKNALLGLDSFLPSPKSQQRNYQMNARLYGSGDLGDGIAFQFLRDKGMDAAHIQTLQRDYKQAQGKLITPELLFTNVEIALPPLWQQQDEWQYSILLIAQQADLVPLKEFAANNNDVWLIDSVAMSTDAIAQLRISALELLGVALALVVLLLFFRYRSISGVALALVPAAAIVITLALLATFDQPILLFHVMALFLVLGLGMDYVIFSYDMCDHPLQTLSAVVLSSVTSLLAFGLLSISQLPVVSAFGVTVLIGNAVNTLGSFLVISLRDSSLSQIGISHE